MQHRGNILVAVLNWGLGHATRSIPIINALYEYGYTPIIASDGAALLLLKKEFPRGVFVELCAYQIRYSRRGGLLKFKMLGQLPKIWKAVNQEHRQTKDIVEQYQIKGIISDNRFGVYHRKVPSVFLTHQLTIRFGIFTKMATFVNRWFVNRFDQCWIPDYKGKNNFTGELSKPIGYKKTPRYIGILSRWSYKEYTEQYDVLVLLSGPEPQRSLLEEKLLKMLLHSDYKVVVVRGVVEEEQTIVQQDKMSIYNYANTNQLRELIGKSSLVISRSGYTTIMDLAQMQKRALFVPTPGQTEQEYLADRLYRQQIALCVTQDSLNMDSVQKAFEYEGFTGCGAVSDWQLLFEVFTQQK
ncbi:MAG: glycosyltransferase [Bacteroidota bacterium]|nr:glycosyltransferase [Bacteroidota bacterium]